ncbi:hypothetical protein DFS34DRAFT_693661 [Phlyctochytrium arcticum]|nr:hypothetical protein DFS34DRAFT_693661 [Phlyctochytrium arcticum]
MDNFLCFFDECVGSESLFEDCINQINDAGRKVKTKTLPQLFTICLQILCAKFHVPFENLESTLNQTRPASPLPNDVMVAELSSEETYSSAVEDLDLDAKGLNVGICPRLRGLLLRDIQQLEKCTYSMVRYFPCSSEPGFVLAVVIPIQQLIADKLLDTIQCDALSLEPSAYLVILIKFCSNYVEVVGEPEAGKGRVKGVDPSSALDSTPQLTVRVLKSETAELHYRDVMCALSESAMKVDGPPYAQYSVEEGGVKLAPFLLSWSLADYLSRRMILIISYRLQYQTSWATAENHLENASWELTSPPSSQESALKDEWPRSTFPDTLDSLYVSNTIHGKPPEKLKKYLNFPLLCVRYMLWRVTMASRYCLVCHKRTHAELNCMKPFVCESPLCTYQYFQLGLGPSIELEIEKHPTIVDILISLSYVAAVNTTLAPFPFGVGRTVRSVCAPGYISSLEDQALLQLHLDSDANCTPQKDDIIEFNFYGQSYRVQISAFFPETSNALVISLQNQKPADFENEKVPFKLISTSFVGWAATRPGQETLEPSDSDRKLFIRVLDKLPPVARLQSFCCGGRFVSPGESEAEDEQGSPDPNLTTSDPRPTKECRPYTLKQHLDEIDTLLYPTLRWILCSSRGFIRELTREEDKIQGARPDYIQLKMIMSNPEKEALFVEQRELLTKEKAIKSLWAFHGSPLSNWHSILRTGLDFERVKILHGRSYGQGIYHALDSSVSIGYASRRTGSWPHTSLGVNLCLSLNEIVNCPEKFASISPYLCVPNNSWVQTRFLLVSKNYADDAEFHKKVFTGQLLNHIFPIQTSAQQTTSHISHIHDKNTRFLPMDPRFTPTDFHKPIQIPESYGIGFTALDGTTTAKKRAKQQWNAECTKPDEALLQLEAEERADRRQNMIGERQVTQGNSDSASDDESTVSPVNQRYNLRSRGPRQNEPASVKDQNIPTRGGQSNSSGTQPPRRDKSVAKRRRP